MVESGRGPVPGGGSGAGAAGPVGAVAATDVEWVYQPVEVHFADGDWALGRISAWWRDAAGTRWCRLRVARSGRPARWEPFDEARVVLLPAGGL
ncbi:hypothetical protein [Kitasatospora sp. NPDC090091]|uniref:hypothetical protein n=1 Tax=Kitasatospora sp. NPDC090091 TaxID=3364081 RepID=UPI0038299117